VRYYVERFLFSPLSCCAAERPPSESHSFVAYEQARTPSSYPPRRPSLSVTEPHCCLHSLGLNYPLLLLRPNSILYFYVRCQSFFQLWEFFLVPSTPHRLTFCPVPLTASSLFPGSITSQRTTAPPSSPFDCRNFSFRVEDLDFRATLCGTFLFLFRRLLSFLYSLFFFESESTLRRKLCPSFSHPPRIFRCSTVSLSEVSSSP